jgi:hypothetical protein
MNGMSDEIASLRRLAARLGELILRPDAECYYDLLAGAVVWVDERPSLANLGQHHIDCVNALRRVWFVRAAKVFGESTPEDDHFWITVKQLFPMWPGFVPERCSITQRDNMASLREQSRKQLDSDFEALLDP